MPQAIATIAELFIYPVKSMAGIGVDEAHVGLDGIIGDRQYSFVRANKAAHNSFPWMTARESARMLLHHPQFAQAPTPDEPEPPIHVRTPDGALVEPGDLVSKLPEPVFLLKSNRGMFDCQHISIFSLASVRGLATEAGCDIDRRQFRANIFVEPKSGKAFDEEKWPGCVVQIGEEVRVALVQRDTRCMMINLNPDTGEQNPKVLKAVAQGHKGQAGVYANVVRPGKIRVGDSIRTV